MKLGRIRGGRFLDSGFLSNINLRAIILGCRRCHVCAPLQPRIRVHLATAVSIGSLKRECGARAVLQKCLLLGLIYTLVAEGYKFGIAELSARSPSQTPEL